MISIRSGLFETNSSSTHTLSIGPRNKQIPVNNIPRNSHVEFEIPEYQSANGHEEESIKKILVTEVSKLSFLFNLIVTVIDYSKNSTLKSLSDLCGRNIDMDSADDIKQAISQDLIFMRWIWEMIKEETGTMIKIPVPTHEYFPYFSTVFSEGSCEFYDEIEAAMVDKDEPLFKALCREIVFNPEIIVEDIDIAYGCTYIESVV